MQAKVPAGYPRAGRYGKLVALDETTATVHVPETRRVTSPRRTHEALVSFHIADMPELDRELVLKYGPSSLAKATA